MKSLDPDFLLKSINWLAIGLILSLVIFYVIIPSTIYLQIVLLIASFFLLIFGYYLSRSYKKSLKSEENYQNTLASFTDIFYKITNSRIEIISPSAEKILGYKPDEMIGKNLGSFLLNPKEEEFLEEILAANGSLVNQRITFLSNEKTSIPVSINAKAKFDKEGNYLGSYGCIRDISSELLQEKHELESSNKSKSFYSDTPAMLHSINSKGIIESVSGYWLDRMGYDKDEVIGKPSSHFLTNDSRKYAEEVVLPDFFKNGYCIDINYQFVKKDGNIMDVLLSATSIYDNDGNFIKSNACITDISDRIKIENKLRKSEDLLQNTGRVAKVGGWEYNLINHEMSWTKETFRIFEIETDTIPGREEEFNYYHPDDSQKISQAFNDCINNGVSYDLDLRLITAKKNRRWVHVIGNAVKKEGRIVKLTGTVVDITTNKKLETTLLKNNIYLKIFYEVNKAISLANNKWNLSSKISTIIMQETGYQWVWIGLKSDDNKENIVQFVQSSESKEDEITNLFELDKFEKEGPAEIAAKTRKNLVVSSIKEYDGSEQWKQNSIEKGFNSFASIPILYNEELYGTLNIYSKKPEVFDDENVYFLSRIAGEFAQSLNTLEIKKLKEELGDFNNLIISSLKVVSIDVDLKRQQIELKGETKEVFGIAPGIMTLQEFSDKIHPFDLETLENMLKWREIDDEFFDFEYRFLNMYGHYVWINSKGKVYKNGKGDFDRIIGISFSIDDKKNAETINMEAQIRGKDNERKRISKELHDGLGQTLSVASMSLSSIKANLDKLDKKQRDMYQLACDMIDQAKNESREISHNLMPSSLVDFGLVVSLESDIKKLNKTSDIEFTFYNNLNNNRFDFRIESNIYNIIREANTNIIKHSKAKHANINIVQHGNILGIAIEDDGIGMNPEIINKRTSEGIGLSNIINRVKSIKGDILFESKNGTLITIQIDTSLVLSQ